jgi:dihydroorotate dehydrogenase electron transfer subunit
MQYQSTKISEIRRVAPGYATLAFTGKQPVSGAPGQFVMIRGNWGSDPILPRAFSLVATGASGVVLVRDVGRGTSLLCHMKPGDDLFVLGPLGNMWTSPSADRTAVLVAGGVGVAPLVFLARELKQSGIRTRFLFGARTADDLPLRADIEEMCTLQVTTEDGSVGHRGLVTDLLDGLLDDSTAVYSCGPHRMLEAVGAIAAARGVPCQVALESPMACGMGTCKGCAVIDPDGNFKYVCTDGPVFEAQRIFGGRHE